MVRQLRERICIVFVKPPSGRGRGISDRISVLKDGNLVSTMPAAEVTTRQLGFLMTGQEFDYQVRDLVAGQTVRQCWRCAITRKGNIITSP